MDDTRHPVQPASPALSRVLARVLAPRRRLSVSQWADAHRFLSSKGSGEPGRWRTDRNPLLREPMDCMGTHNAIQDVVCQFPIQLGKTELAINALGYTMTEAPGPIMVALPGEVSQKKWIAQKLTPALAETPALRDVLTSTATRDAANQRDFKDFLGGQLFIEHGGSPQRLKSTTVRVLIVDELDEFAANLKSGDDPVAMLEGRTSAFPSSKKRLWISTPTVEGHSRIAQMFEKSDQRYYHVPCPDCGHMQPLEWKGLHWSADATACWYACRECGVAIDEHHKQSMLERGEWVPTHPGRPVRGYTCNGLYYPFGLGPRWLDLVKMWLAAQGDPAALKTFVNDRLAETWQDPAMRQVKDAIIAERAEPFPLRPVPWWAVAVTAGVDTQDNRLAVHISAWGRHPAGGLRCWPVDYVELPGDPADDAVWSALDDLLTRPIEHDTGGVLRVEAVAIDMMGHRTEAVKAYVRSRRVRRPMAIFGAVSNNAPILGKGKLADVNWRGQMDKRGVMTYQVGTVAAKHVLYGWLGTDAEKELVEDRRMRFSDQLPDSYFGGLVAEVYDPRLNRFVKRRGAPRNEPLDGWTYSYAAAHHPELRLHRWTKADWERRAAAVLASANEPAVQAPPPASADTSAETVTRETPPSTQRTQRPRGGLVDNWEIR